MAVVNLKAKDFSNREELEKHLASLNELTPETKADVTITGSSDELKKLHLSHGKKCWGVAVVASDVAKIKKQPFERLDRGKIYKPEQPDSVDIKKTKER